MYDRKRYWQKNIFQNPKITENDPILNNTVTFLNTRLLL